MFLELVIHQTTNVARHDKRRAKNVDKSLSQESKFVSNYISTEKSSLCEQATFPKGTYTRNLLRRATFVAQWKPALYAGHYGSIKNRCQGQLQSSICSLLVAGCDSYAVLSEADRAHSYIGTWGNYYCDGGLATQWYRFTGAAGNMMRSSCKPGNGKAAICNTSGGGWLNGAHPSIAEGEVSRTVCFDWDSNCCWQSQTIRVKNCGLFYLYYLSEPVRCNMRYCGSA